MTLDVPIGPGTADHVVWFQVVMQAPNGSIALSDEGHTEVHGRSARLTPPPAPPHPSVGAADAAAPSLQPAD